MILKRAAIALSLLGACSTTPLGLYPGFPEVVHSDQKYVLYSHGLIVEGNDPKPIHSEFGAYEFDRIKEALFVGGDFNLIAHHRPENTDPGMYADTLVSWVERLLRAGVDPGDITLIGFSRGAQITAVASSQLVGAGINTVLMGLCFESDYRVEPLPQLGGHVLSIYETSDVVQSCSGLLERSTEALTTQEVAISTGLRHGAFFKPMPEWIEPLKEWLRLH